MQPGNPIPMIQVQQGFEGFSASAKGRRPDQGGGGFTELRRRLNQSSLLRFFRRE